MRIRMRMFHLALLGRGAVDESCDRPLQLSKVVRSKAGEMRPTVLDRLRHLIEHIRQGRSVSFPYASHIDVTLDRLKVAQRVDLLTFPSLTFSIKHWTWRLNSSDDFTFASLALCFKAHEMAGPQSP